MVHEFKVNERFFNEIKSGKKIYEGRLYDEKRKQLKIGDEIIFKKNPEFVETIKTRVVDLIYFKSINEMINILPNDLLGFDKSSKEEIEEVYRGFYSVEKEQEFGVVAIKFFVLEDK